MDRRDPRPTDLPMFPTPSGGSETPAAARRPGAAAGPTAAEPHAPPSPLSTSSRHEPPRPYGPASPPPARRPVEPDAAGPARPTAPAALSVAELARRLKRIVEGGTLEVRVEGEISGLRVVSSGHAYFTLKDEREDATLDCVMYRSAPPRSLRLLADGARVVLFGRATVYVQRGRLQFVAEDARPAGRGALLEALEKLRHALAAEGLFAAERKRKLPADPRVIGVVTSGDGAAIHDIVKVASRRGSVRILLARAPVQGATAAQRIARAIAMLCRVREVEAIVVGRGGGSAEDLAAYNDEIVVRQVAAARVPVVSAVGHEIDVTLTDLAADARAATPSQAAELLVPDAAARRATLEHLSARMRRALLLRLARTRTEMERLRTALGSPRRLIDERQQRVDDALSRMRGQAVRLLGTRRAELQRLERRLAARHPKAVLARARSVLAPLEVRLGAAARRRVAVLRRGLGASAARLDAMSPLAVLSRGYAIALDERSRAVRDAAEIAPGDIVRVRVHRGAFRARVLGTGEDGAARPVDAGTGVGHLASTARDPTAALTFALIGHPIAHSFSPAIHGAALRALGLPHRYQLVDAASDAALAAAMARLREGSLAGANVTLPHKRAVLGHVDEVAPSAAEIGAANVLCVVSGVVVAHNTDAEALALELAAMGARGGATAVVLGAGGAGLASIAACRRLGCARVVVTSRSFRDADAIACAGAAHDAQALGAVPLPWPGTESSGGARPSPAWDEAWRAASVVVQATSAGMAGADPGDALAMLVPWAALPGETLAYDVVYTPRVTPFVEAARARGLRTSDGLGMLVRQAALSLALWTGAPPPLDAMRAAAETARAERPRGAGAGGHDRS